MWKRLRGWIPDRPRDPTHSSPTRSSIAGTSEKESPSLSETRKHRAAFDRGLAPCLARTCLRGSWCFLTRTVNANMSPFGSCMFMIHVYTSKDNHDAVFLLCLLVQCLGFSIPDPGPMRSKANHPAVLRRSTGWANRCPHLCGDWSWTALQDASHISSRSYVMFR